ncbi:SURF1 family protein [Xylanimonas oleitrophica]|uniref:SURF1-like protein n=1 Tax=Xylanimonas oleitrophica TaxID=2607479 RepID=A0A2W5Y3U1_9MICO|nr:SURF1 family protein [Xylanimonas oleitrophica]PZR52524.1 SURF1 family protein [Xylanimonas oleitrophica]
MTAEPGTSTARPGAETSRPAGGPPGPPPDPDAGVRTPRTRRQWVTLGVAAVLLAALCVAAAVWQWHRYTEREAQIALVERNYGAEPVPVEQVLPGPGAVLEAEDVWRPATLTGRYVPDATVLLRNRPVNATPGFHVLVPFETDSGLVVVVDRGFVPLGADSSQPDEVPAPPAGQVRAVVTLRADEPRTTRGAPAGQVQAISTEQVLAAAPAGAGWAEGRTVEAYGQLRSEDPAPTQSLVALTPPDLDPGSHLSYTFQWCVFALGAVGGYVLLWRRETRGSTVTAGDLLLATGEQGTRSRRPERRRRPTDEELEDALLDGP